MSRIPQLVLPTANDDELWRATIASLTFTDEAPAPTTGRPWVAVGGNGLGTWVATGGSFNYGASPDNIIAVSTDDGATWSTVDCGLQLCGAPVWDGNRFVCAISNAFALGTSSDGSTWTSVPIDIATFPYEVHLVGGRWFAGDASATRRGVISDGFDIEGNWSTPQFVEFGGVDLSTDGLDLMMVQGYWWSASTGPLGVGTAFFTPGTWIGAGSPWFCRYGPHGGDYFATDFSSAAWWDSPDGKTWTKKTDATLTEKINDAYWDGSSWWCPGASGLWELPLPGTTWTLHADLPDTGVEGLAVYGLPLDTRLGLGVTVDHGFGFHSASLPAGRTISEGLPMLAGLQVGFTVAEGERIIAGMPTGRTIAQGHNFIPVGPGGGEGFINPLEARPAELGPPDPEASRVPLDAYLDEPGAHR